MHYEDACEIADKVAIDCNSPAHGVAVTVDYSPLYGLNYAIWTIRSDRLVQHTLHCDSTNSTRLQAHVLGFIKNTSPALNG